MAGNTPSLWNSWIQQTRDQLSREELDALMTSLLQDTSLGLSPGRDVEDPNLLALLPQGWEEDETFRSRLLWHISQLGENGKKCISQLAEFGLEWNGKQPGKCIQKF